MPLSPRLLLDFGCASIRHDKGNCDEHPFFHYPPRSYFEAFSTSSAHDSPSLTFYDNFTMANNFKPPDGAPPQYPNQVHHDAGPYYPPNSASPGPGQFPQQGLYQNEGYYGPPQGAYQQGPWQQQQQYYGPPQQQMYYQQGPPPGGYYDDRGRGGGGAAGGICAGLLGALACCCCLDFLF